MAYKFFFQMYSGIAIIVAMLLYSFSDYDVTNPLHIEYWYIDIEILPYHICLAVYLWALGFILMEVGRWVKQVFHIICSIFLGLIAFSFPEIFFFQDEVELIVASIAYGMVAHLLMTMVIRLLKEAYARNIAAPDVLDI